MDLFEFVIGAGDVVVRLMCFPSFFLMFENTRKSICSNLFYFFIIWNNFIKMQFKNHFKSIKSFIFFFLIFNYFFIYKIFSAKSIYFCLFTKNNKK